VVHLPPTIVNNDEGEAMIIILRFLSFALFDPFVQLEGEVPQIHFEYLFFPVFIEIKEASVK
jgi:hypothetical protein